MTPDPFETYDAAYLAGSLSPQDRVAFEAHLPTCRACSARVSDLRELPALLALAPEAAFGDAGPVPDTLLPGLVRRVRAERRRRLLTAGAVLVGAAAVLVAVLVVVLPDSRFTSYRPPAEAVVMANVIDIPLQARAQVLTNDSWAQVNIWCTYAAGTPTRDNYQAVARTRTGQAVVLGSWPGVPGQTAVIRTPTSVHTADLVSIEIVGSGGRTFSRLAV